MNSAKDSFGTFSDVTLAQLSKDGDDCAFKELLMRYVGIITSIARKYSAQGYEENDFVQEGLMGLLYAAKTYDPDGGMSFKNYVSLVAERRFISIIRRQNTQKSVPLSAIVGLDTLDSEVVDLSGTPEGQIMLKEQVDLAMQQLRGILSEFELKVFLLYIGGLSYNAIAKKLGVSEKSVDNALHRAKRKIQKLRKHCNGQEERNIPRKGHNLTEKR